MLKSYVKRTITTSETYERAETLLICTQCMLVHNLTRSCLDYYNLLYVGMEKSIADDYKEKKTKL